ncbi:MAG: hypothetical protein OQK73_08035, partial [Gammaproteobacteria bacterium]|nr:hypothetical protein [Gammaproteobacteria bacterium]
TNEDKSTVRPESCPELAEGVSKDEHRKPPHSWFDWAHHERESGGKFVVPSQEHPVRPEPFDISQEGLVEGRYIFYTKGEYQLLRTICI